MKIMMCTHDTRFQQAGDFEPRMDKDGVQRRDKSGGTNLPLWAGKLIAWLDGDAETILVTVAASEPPTVSQGEYVLVERLEAMPWVRDGNVRVAFRAASIRPVTNGATTASGKSAPAPSN